MFLQRMWGLQHRMDLPDDFIDDDYNHDLNDYNYEDDDCNQDNVDNYYNHHVDDYVDNDGDDDIDQWYARHELLSYDSPVDEDMDMVHEEFYIPQKQGNIIN